MKAGVPSFDRMNNSEQTPYNRRSLKLYCKKDHGNPIQYPKPDSKKNTIKSESNSDSKSRMNGNGKHNSRTKKQQFWKYDGGGHIDQHDMSEFYPECEFIYQSTWYPTTCWIDDWENPYEYMIDDYYQRERYQRTPCLDAGWVDCKCSLCGGCICSKYDHMCVKLSICRCRNRPSITILNFKNGAQYNCDPYSSSDDDNNENNYGTNDYNSRPSQKYSYGDDEILNSCWGCYSKTCLDCNPPPINSDDECGDPRCRECYGDGYRWGY